MSSHPQPGDREQGFQLLTAECRKLATFLPRKVGLFEDSRKMEIRDLQGVTQPQEGPENIGKLLYGQKGGRWEGAALKENPLEERESQVVTASDWPGPGCPPAGWALALSLAELLPGQETIFPCWGSAREGL